MALKEKGYDENVDFDKLLEECDWDKERFEAKLAEIAATLPKTTGITYGTGKLWYRFNEWKRKAEYVSESPSFSSSHHEQGSLRRWLCKYQPILRRRKLYKCSSLNPQVLPGVTMEERIRITAESPWAVGWAEGIAKMAGYIPSTPEYHEEVKRLSRFVSERLWMG